MCAEDISIEAMNQRTFSSIIKSAICWTCVASNLLVCSKWAYEGRIAVATNLQKTGTSNGTVESTAGKHFVEKYRTDISEAGKY